MKVKAKNVHTQRQVQNKLSDRFHSTDLCPGQIFVISVHLYMWVNTRNSLLSFAKRTHAILPLLKILH